MMVAIKPIIKGPFTVTQASPTRTRPPAVAGSFYPASPQQLRQTVADLLAAATKQIDSENQSSLPHAIIAPHAGYIYSGPIAASAYARFTAARSAIKKVVLIGPAHRVHFLGIALSTADAFATPLGLVPLDRRLIESRLAPLPFVIDLDKAHAPEHGLEVHLPFLQVLLDDFTLVPMVFGQSTPQQLFQALEAVWGGPETLIIISSDLSHYHDYHTAQKMDHAASLAIESLCPQDLHPEQACGHTAVQALLLAAQQHHLRAQTIDLRNSGDTASPKDSVVGYGSFLFTQD